MQTPGEQSSVQGIDEQLETLLLDRPLIVVSNRQPYRHDNGGEDGLTVEEPTGGLTGGLDPVMQQTGGTWIAWGDGDGDFAVADGHDCVSVPPDDPNYQLKRIRLSDEQVRDYYYGFSNQVLWPICHSALTNIRCDPEFWQRYSAVNQRFAAAVADQATDRALVWFQDYHLALAPRHIRPSLPADAIVMHFWHIPWPAWDTYRACPHGQEVLRGLLGNDVLGFHVPRYRTNFLDCVDAAVDGATIDRQRMTVSYQGRTTAVEVAPMGVPYQQIQRSTATANGSFWRSFTREHGLAPETRLAVGVDRLDYSKGIVERLRALEHLWETRPQWRGELTYVQNASESRSRIPAYQKVQRDVTDTVDRINRRFGTADWQPVIYFTERLSRDDLYELYRRADVGIVSALRDGMNLVAQEYVAAQHGDEDGVLILSDQTGVHDELGRYAVSITPAAIDAFAHAIESALTMSSRERHRRMTRLRQWVATHDIETWLATNLRGAMRVARSDDR